MRITYRDLSIEVRDDDPRTARVLALLFMDVPMPFPPPPMPPVEAPPVEPPPPPPPPQPPPVEVPAAMWTLWDRLDDVQRKDLALLAERSRSPRELEAALGVTQAELMGRRSTLGRFAARLGLGRLVNSSGRGRAHRVFSLSPGVAAWVRALVEGTATSPTKAVLSTRLDS